MRLSLFFALRYMFSPSRLGAVGWITLISAVAIAVVSMAMVLVLSVYNGYVQLIERATGVSTPEFVIAPAVGTTLSLEAEPKLRIALESEAVECYALVLEGLAMLRGSGGESLVQIYGVEESYWEVLPKDSLLLGGEVPLSVLNESDKEQIVLGAGVLTSGVESIDAADAYTLFFPRRIGMINPLAPSTAFRSRDVELSGLLRPVDKSLDQRGYVRLELMQELLGYEPGVASYIAIRGRIPSEKLKQRLIPYLPEGYRLLDRQEQHPELTLLVRVEKLMVYIIMLFILLLATFNLISGLAMLVMEKRGDLMMLSSLGMSARDRRRIFALSGLLIAFTGAALGLLLGLSFGYVQQRWGLVMAGSGVFAMPFPIVLRGSDFVLILFGILFISFITSWALSLFMRRLAKSGIR